MVAGIRKASLSAAVFDRLILHLRSHRSHGVLYIADEHNGIFKYNRQKDYPFREFMSFTAGLVDGSVRACRCVAPGPHMLLKDRAYLAVSGSAHSAFENNLSSGQERRLRYIRPPQKAEFTALLATPV